jgi:hypothetical protein
MGGQANYDKWVNEYAQLFIYSKDPSKVLDNSGKPYDSATYNQALSTAKAELTKAGSFITGQTGYGLTSAQAADVIAAAEAISAPDTSKFSDTIVRNSINSAYNSLYITTVGGVPQDKNKLEEEKDKSTPMESLLTNFIMGINHAIHVLIKKALGAPSLYRMISQQPPPNSTDYVTVTVPDDSKKINTVFNNIIKKLYEPMMKFALVIFLIGLVYLGVLTLASTASSRRAEYMEKLTSWATGLVLLFAFSYIMIYIIQINNSFSRFFVGMVVPANNVVAANGDHLSATVETQITEGIKEIIKNPKYQPAAQVNIMAPGLSPNQDQITAELRKDLLNYGIIGDEPDPLTLALYIEYKKVDGKKGQFVSAIVYGMGLGLVIWMFLIYFMRTFMIAFLIVIFPLVMGMYCLDRIKDGKSQHFSTWLNYYVSEVFVNSIHAMVFCFVFAVVSNPDPSKPTPGIIKLIAMYLIIPTGDFVRQFFSLKSVKSHSMGFGALALGTVMGRHVMNQMTDSPKAFLKAKFWGASEEKGGKEKGGSQRAIAAGKFKEATASTANDNQGPDPRVAALVNNSSAQNSMGLAQLSQKMNGSAAAPASGNQGPNPRIASLINNSPAQNSMGLAQLSQKASAPRKVVPAKPFSNPMSYRLNNNSGTSPWKTDPQTGKRVFSPSKTNFALAGKAIGDVVGGLAGLAGGAMIGLASGDPAKAGAFALGGADLMSMIGEPAGGFIGKRFDNAIARENRTGSISQSIKNDFSGYVTTDKHISSILDANGNSVYDFAALEGISEKDIYGAQIEFENGKYSATWSETVDQITDSVLEEDIQKHDAEINKFIEELNRDYNIQLSYKELQDSYNIDRMNANNVSAKNNKLVERMINSNKNISEETIETRVSAMASSHQEYLKKRKETYKEQKQNREKAAAHFDKEFVRLGLSSKETQKQRKHTILRNTQDAQ